MSEPVFWSLGTWSLDRHVAVVAAPSHAAAMVLLGVREAWAVNRCYTASLIEQAQSDPGKVLMVKVDRLPSRYDAFKHPDRKGWDYQRMEDEGFDVS